MYLLCGITSIQGFKKHHCTKCLFTLQAFVSSVLASFILRLQMVLQWLPVAPVLNPESSQVQGWQIEKFLFP